MTLWYRRWEYRNQIPRLVESWEFWSTPKESTGISQIRRLVESWEFWSTPGILVCRWLYCSKFYNRGTLTFCSKMMTYTGYESPHSVLVTSRARGKIRVTLLFQSQVTYEWRCGVGSLGGDGLRLSVCKFRLHKCGAFEFSFTSVDFSSWPREFLSFRFPQVGGTPTRMEGEEVND